MIICFFNVIRHHIFKWEHSFYIQISGSCNQIFRICIFSSQLKSYKMATIIQIFSIHTIIFYCMPARRFYNSDRISFFSRHQIRTYICRCHPTSSQFIQFTIGFIRIRIHLRFRKCWNIIINDRISFLRHYSLCLFFRCITPTS